MIDISIEQIQKGFIFRDRERKQYVADVPELLELVVSTIVRSTSAIQNDQKILYDNLKNRCEYLANRTK